MRITADVAVTIERANGEITTVRRTVTHQQGDNPRFIPELAETAISAATGRVVRMLVLESERTDG